MVYKKCDLNLNSNMECANCNKPLIGRQTKFCSKKCKMVDGNKKHQNYKCQKERGLKRKIALVNLLGGKCCECGYSKNLSALEFHHINPEDKDHTLDIRQLSNCTWNFCISEISKCKLICSNCHREHHNPLMNNWQTLNEDEIINYVMDIKEPTLRKLCDQCGNKMNSKNKLCHKCLKRERKQIERLCKCGKVKARYSIQCMSCSNKQPKIYNRKVVRPTKEDLEKLIWESPMSQLKKVFGVSDVAIKKWCKAYNISTPPQGYWNK